MNAFTGTNAFHSKQRDATPTIWQPSVRHRSMSKIEELADRVERLLVRHEELRRTNALLVEQLASVAGERDNLRSRLSAARSRIDVLLERLPRDATAPVDGGETARPNVT
jgi:cell division protein ZapB